MKIQSKKEINANARNLLNEKSNAKQDLILNSVATVSGILSAGIYAKELMMSKKENKGSFADNKKFAFGLGGLAVIGAATGLSMYFTAQSISKCIGLSKKNK
jgi:hypothetical protein